MKCEQRNPDAHADYVRCGRNNRHPTSRKPVTKGVKTPRPPVVDGLRYGTTDLGRVQCRPSPKPDGRSCPTRTNSKEHLVVKLVVRDRETIQEAVRRFRKLVERSGIKKEMRRREYYEKPSEVNRRARLRAERRARRNRLMAGAR